MPLDGPHLREISSATPVTLLALAAGSPARTARLSLAARHLEAAGLGGAAAALSAHARAGAELERWVGQVGAAFADADPGLDDGEQPQVLFVDPTGDGRIIEVFGDLSIAQHVAVVVPGVGTTLANEPTTLQLMARHLYDAASAIDPSVAVIAWLDYDPPGTLDAPLRGSSRSGGRALARFVASLRLRRSASVSVVGHSYGSLVAAEALRAGMHVDDVIVAGSAGLGAGRARDLPLDGADLFALRAPFDVIGWSEVFGRDPSDPRFGATRLDTGDGHDQPLGHSSYFEPGSESLANIAAVVTQRDDRLDVVQPSDRERAIGVVDDAWRTAFDPPVDSVQQVINDVNGVLDQLESVLPGPLGDLTALQGAVRDVAVEEGQRLVDELQRVTSPDFVGDVVADAWDALW